MSVRNVKLNGRRYVLVPRNRWDAMQRQIKSRAAKIVKLPPPSSDGYYSIDHVRISLANKMIAHRKAAGLTQAELAKRARVRVETISRLENALHMPSVRTFDKIEKALRQARKRPAA